MCPPQVLMLMLGRLLAMVGAEEELCRLVLPLLTDTLAAQVADANAEVGDVPSLFLSQPLICFLSLSTLCLLACACWGCKVSACI